MKKCILESCSLVVRREGGEDIQKENGRWFETSLESRAPQNVEINVFVHSHCKYRSIKHTRTHRHTRVLVLRCSQGRANQRYSSGRLFSYRAIRLATLHRPRSSLSFLLYEYTLALTSLMVTELSYRVTQSWPHLRISENFVCDKSQRLQKVFSFILHRSFLHLSMRLSVHFVLIVLLRKSIISLILQRLSLFYTITKPFSFYSYKVIFLNELSMDRVCQRIER